MGGACTGIIQNWSGKKTVLCTFCCVYLNDIEQKVGVCFRLEQL